jgi:hypothetical protein
MKLLEETNNMKRIEWKNEEYKAYKPVIPTN